MMRSWMVLICMGLNQPIPLSLYQDTKAMIKKKESAGSNLLYRESSS